MLTSAQASVKGHEEIIVPEASQEKHAQKCQDNKSAPEASTVKFA